MSILFTGYYGQLNTGDDAFCLVSDWGARKYWKQSNIKFHSRNLPLRYDGTELASGYITDKKFRGQEIFEMLPAGIMNKKIIYSGGSVFHTEIKRLSKNSILQLYSKMGITDLGAIGVSLGPFKSKNDFNSIKSYLNRFSFLGLRDTRSYEVAQEMRLEIPFVDAFDLAALLPEIYPINKVKNDSPVIGVSICNYESYTNSNLKNEQRRFDKIVATLRMLVKQIPNVKIKILNFNAHPILGDIEISQKLINKLPENINTEIIDYNKNTFLMWNEVSLCDVVLATRLHAGIFSYFSQTPFLQIEYHKKCKDFLNEVNYPIEFQIGDIEESDNEIVEKVLKLISNSNLELFTNTEYIQNKALLNFIEFKNHFN